MSRQDAARADLVEWIKCLHAHRLLECRHIETRYGVAGLPAPAVTEVLTALADGREPETNQLEASE